MDYSLEQCLFVKTNKIMSAKGSKVSIYGAILANVAIAISKFFAGSYTGSSAMISEGIHSLVDTSNGVLLLYGIKKSERPADVSHPFGYGMEIYFWSFVVSILIFALGGGIAIYEGIHHIIEPAVVENVKVNYIVLGLAILFEGTSLFVALKEFKKDNGKFKVPSLRNLGFTAPYMHDGRFNTLEEVVAFYANDVNHSAKYDNKMTHYSNGRKRLDSAEQSQIVAYLHTLNDSNFVKNPAFSNPFSKNK